MYDFSDREDAQPRANNEGTDPGMVFADMKYTSWAWNDAHAAPGAPVLVHGDQEQFERDLARMRDRQARRDRYIDHLRWTIAYWIQ